MHIATANLHVVVRYHTTLTDNCYTQESMHSIAGAIGAFGGVLVNIAFRQSFLHNQNGNAAYISFIVFYGLCFALTWFVYMRPSSKRLVGV